MTVHFAPVLGSLHQDLLPWPDHIPAEAALAVSVPAPVARSGPGATPEVGEPSDGPYSASEALVAPEVPEKRPALPFEPEVPEVPDTAA